MLTVFDAPDAFSTCTRRIRSNTPLQALSLLNDQASFEFAEYLAARVLRDAPADARIQYAFQLCLARRPEADELSKLSELCAQQMESFRRSPDEMEPWQELASRSGVKAEELAAWTTVGRVLLNLDETITRE